MVNVVVRGVVLSLPLSILVFALSASSCSDGGNSTYVTAGGAGGNMGQGGSQPCGFAPCAGNTGDGGTTGSPGGAAGEGGEGPIGSAGQGEGGSPGGGPGVYPSCAELHTAEPTLPSGTYAIQPALEPSPFDVYCDMENYGGGWTLVLNEGTSFDPLTMGVVDEVCRTTNCANRAYATVPVVSGIMLDMKDGDIVDDQLLARAVVTDVHASSQGKTARDLFTAGPNFFEAEDNSNLTLTTTGGCDAVPGDANQVLCGTPVLTFGDRVSGCPFDDVTFAIGISESYTAGWPNCAGWPMQANFEGTNWWPDNVRVWVR